MQEFLQRLQDSDFGSWVSAAPTLWAYPTILMLHTVGLAMIVGPNAVLDLRLLGTGRRIPIAHFDRSSEACGSVWRSTGRRELRCSSRKRPRREWRGFST